MQTIFVNNYKEMSEVTYNIIKNIFIEKSHPIISMTTGGTPRGLFELLVNGINNNEIDIQKATIMNLDEYIGPKNAPYTVHTFMYEQFYNKINHHPKEIFLIDGSTNDIPKELENYSEILKTRPRDIQILGLGTNGHIGANEPGTPFNSTIFLAKHDDSTIQSTMKEYNISYNDAPSKMITLGFTEILEASQVVLMVSGKHKAEAVKKVLEGPINNDCPASFLREQENVIMIIDKDASALLEYK